MPIIQTPVGTLSYPHLFKARPKAEGSDTLVFSTVLLFNEQQMKSPAYKAMLAAVDAVAKSAYPKLILGKSLKSPFRDCAEKENFPSEYRIFFNSWSLVKPGVIDVGRNPIVDSNDVWGGSMRACRSTSILGSIPPAARASTWVCSTSRSSRARV